MHGEIELHYLCRPTSAQAQPLMGEFVTTQEFLTDEMSSKELWTLIHEQFRTRSKFLAIWQNVKFIAIHRDNNGLADGFVLVSSLVNWQIDYVVVKTSSRGQGIAAGLVRLALQNAFLHHTPYVMLTSKESLRPLYEGCGFQVVASNSPVVCEPSLK